MALFQWAAIVVGDQRLKILKRKAIAMGNCRRYEIFFNHVPQAGKRTRQRDIDALRIGEQKCEKLVHDRCHFAEDNSTTQHDPFL